MLDEKLFPNEPGSLLEFSTVGMMQDKGNSEVRPTGVGKVIRRTIGKCVTKVMS